MKVLFIGNSHTYFNDMPALFADMYCQLRGIRPDVTMLAYSGRTLKWHYNEYFALRFEMLYGNYDYCVIQQYAHPFPDLAETVEYMNEIISLAKANDIKPIIFMTWAEKNKPEMTAVMSETYRNLAASNDCSLAEIGEVFAEILARVPEIELYFRDGEHASVYGDYLTAALLAGMISKVKDISSLDDRGIDFGISIDQMKKQPLCEYDKEKMLIQLDKEKTAVIKEAVNRKLSKQP